MTIREKLCEATSVKQKKKEDDYTFVKRLIATVEDLSDDDWGKLSTEAQEYANSVIEAKKNYTEWDELPADEVPLFPDETAEDDADSDEIEPSEDTEEDTSGDTTEETEESEKDMETEKKPKKKKSPPAEKPAAAKAKKAATKPAAKEKEKPVAAKSAKANGAAKKPAKSASGKKTGIIGRIRQIVIKNPTISTDDLIAKLEKEEYKGSRMAISTTKQATRDVLKMLVAAKMLDIEL